MDHVDLIMGHVTGKVDGANYSSTDNTDAKIVKTFSKAELAAAKGVDGFYTLTSTTRPTATSTSVSAASPSAMWMETATLSPTSAASRLFLPRRNLTTSRRELHQSLLLRQPVRVTVSETGDTPENSGGPDFGHGEWLCQPGPTKIAGYSAGQFDVDGGVMEIVAYNSANGYAYAVNGRAVNWPRSLWAS